MRIRFKTGQVFALLISAVSLAPQLSRAQETEAVSSSQLTSVTLPSGTERVLPGQVPADIKNALAKVIEAGGTQVRQGRNEVLVWSPAGFNKAKMAAIKSQFGQKLQKGGWTYEEGAPDKEIAPMTLVTALKTTPSRKALIGFWVPTDEGLLLAWTEMLPSNSNAKGATTKNEAVKAPVKTPVAASTRSDSATLSATVLEVAGMTRNINVMKGVAPPKPTFAPLKPKPGYVRGWVKDWKGKPLQGAVIGVRSTSAGGFYSGASAKTDARGYYEIQVPWGVASFYCAGYSVDWGDEGRAALGLGAADGEADQFASANGAIENWVLWTYGIADRNGVSDQPEYSGNYFGGTFSVYTSISESSDSSYELPLGSTYELTLTPIGALFDGSKGRSFVIRRKLDSYNSLLYVNNIPIGRYKISAKLIQDGESKSLNIKETGPYSNYPNGLEPKEARGESTLTLRPYGAKAEMATANHGHWGSLGITLTP